MGSCLCKRMLKTPDQATEDQNSPGTRELIFAGENSLAQAPDDAGSNHSVVGAPEEESPDNVVRNKQLRK